MLRLFSGAHVILYSQSAEADRVFLRDQLGFANVDAGDGWLIFKLPPAELAVHPTDGEPRHELYLMCEDVDQTLRDVTAAGATISEPTTDQRWGRLAVIRLPSGTTIGIYQPRHQVAYEL